MSNDSDYSLRLALGLILSLANGDNAYGDLLDNAISQVGIENLLDAVLAHAAVFTQVASEDLEISPTQFMREYIGNG